MGEKAPPPLTHRSDHPQQQDTPLPPQDDTINPNEDYEHIIENFCREPIAGQQHMRKKYKAGGEHPLPMLTPNPTQIRPSQADSHERATEWQIDTEREQTTNDQ